MRNNLSFDNFRDEFILLDQTRYDLADDIAIFGRTLWSHIASTTFNAVSRHQTDFKRIRHWPIEGHNLAHSADADWLDREYARPRTKSWDYASLSPHTTHQQSKAPVHQNSPVDYGVALDITV
jgi:hypothetical protein